MSSQGRRGRRDSMGIEIEEFDEEVPIHRPRVERDEQSEYEEWRKERGGRGRKRRGHRDQEHHRRDEDAD